MPFTFRQFAALVLAVSASAGSRSDAPVRVQVAADHLRQDIRYLASPALEGRGSGTPGLDKAAEYISKQFAAAGLRPGNGSGFLQHFPVTTGAKAGPGNALSCTGCATDTLEQGIDFLPMNLSAPGSVSGPLVFAGYGITASEYGYDDYAGVDARGKIVLILRHEPQEYENSSVFEGRVYTEHSQMLRKALNARDHGAAAVLFVNDSANHSGPDTLEALTTLAAPGSVAMPFVQVRASVVEQWFETAGRSFVDLTASIDGDLRPVSFEFPPSMRFSVTADITSRQTQAANVVGFLPGVTDEYVVIGAHYDHLGRGEQYSLAPETAGSIHPGADDNASGTAAVIGLARWFAAQPKMKRGVLFIAFAGEEIGLLGSTWYTSHPVLPLDKAIAMINMDMIGRLKDRKLTVGGTSSGAGLREIVSLAGKDLSFELQMDDLAVYGSSDHTTFKARSIPVLFFFTGLHSDYHRPTDTADRIDMKATAGIAGFVGRVAHQLAQSADRLAFVRSPAAAKSPQAPPASGR